LDLEPYQVHNNEETSSKSKSICEDQLENAVIKQELMAAKEEMADLKAKIYVSDKEKRGLDLTLQEKRSVETMLRTHIHHLQEQVNNSSHLQASKKDSKCKTEDLLRQRIENLLSTLDKVIQTSEMRQKESGDLIQDLKKANSTLSEALDKTRRKYQSKIKKLEQQFIEENNK